MRSLVWVLGLIFWAFVAKTVVMIVTQTISVQRSVVRELQDNSDRLEQRVSDLEGKALQHDDEFQVILQAAQGDHCGKQCPMRGRK